MIQKEYLIGVGGYSEEFRCQDGYDLWLKMIASYKPYNVNIPLFYYRQHGHNMTSQQAKILATRTTIKRRFVESEIQAQVPRVLDLVCAIRRSVYPESHPSVQLAGKPLIWYTLNEVLKSKLLDRVVVSSEDDAVLEYASKFPDIVPLKRSAELTKSTARMEDVAQEVLTGLKAASGYEPDAVCTLSINTALRRADHFDRVIDRMIIFGMDSVVSVQEELGLFYRHLRLGLAPVGNSGGALRLEREALYKANGAIHLTRTHTIQAEQLDAQRIRVYWLASILTFISERYVLPAIPIQKGPLGIYPRHSRQPQEWGMSPYALVAFLAKVTQDKPGVLASMWLYIGLLGSYLVPAVLVFLRLTLAMEKTTHRTNVSTKIRRYTRLAATFSRNTGPA